MSIPCIKLALRLSLDEASVFETSDLKSLLGERLVIEFNLIGIKESVLSGIIHFGFWLLSAVSFLKSQINIAVAKGALALVAY